MKSVFLLLLLGWSSLFSSLFAGMISSIETTQEGVIIEEFWVPAPSMKRKIHAEVLLPPDYLKKVDHSYPVLYVMHGSAAPWDTWAQMPKLKAFLVTHPMLIVCFDGDAESWYIDSSHKPDSQFTTFFFHDLIPWIDHYYRTIPNAKGRGVTGYSMGGFGAFHFLLEKPDAFGSGASLILRK